MVRVDVAKNSSQEGAMRSWFANANNLCIDVAAARGFPVLPDGKGPASFSLCSQAGLVLKVA